MAQRFRQTGACGHGDITELARWEMGQQRISSLL